MGFYDYTVPAPKGAEVKMSEYEGKVVMVVNTATGCGFTPQYKDIAISSETRRPEQMKKFTHSASFTTIRCSRR